MSFNALLINRSEDKKISASLETIDESQLPEGDVVVDIDYSTLNYKDGLAITGKAPVVRSYPMVPGIDFAGTVSESSHPNWKVGDKVILNGWGVGEGHWGGLSQKAKVKGDWLIALPEKTQFIPSDVNWHSGLYRHAMCNGTSRSRRKTRRW